MGEGGSEGGREGGREGGWEGGMEGGRREGGEGELYFLDYINIIYKRYIRIILSGDVDRFSWTLYNTNISMSMKIMNPPASENKNSYSAFKYIHKRHS